MKSRFKCSSCLTRGLFFPSLVITRQPHQKPLFVYVGDCVRRNPSTSTADNSPELCEVGGDFTGVAGLGTLATSKP